MVDVCAAGVRASSSRSSRGRPQRGRDPWPAAIHQPGVAPFPTTAPRQAGTRGPDSFRRDRGPHQGGHGTCAPEDRKGGRGATRAMKYERPQLALRPETGQAETTTNATTDTWTRLDAVT